MSERVWLLLLQSTTSSSQQVVLEAIQLRGSVSPIQRHSQTSPCLEEVCSVTPRMSGILAEGTNETA